MMTDQSSSSPRLLPNALLANFTWFEALDSGASVVLEVPDEYQTTLDANLAAPEVVAIQRLITLARRASLSVRWRADIAARVSAQPYQYPLLAVLLVIDTVSHFVWTDGDWQTRNVRNITGQLQKHKLLKKSEKCSDIALSLEGRVSSLAPDIYDLSTLKLLPRDSFVSLAVEVFGSQIGSKSPARQIYSKASLVGTILAELIENSDMHGRLDAGGRPILTAAVRGVMFRRVAMTFDSKQKSGGKAIRKEVECLEASIFDSGIGYFESFMRRPVSEEDDVALEWKILHKCLERHFYPELADARAAHRGMGLYESLRAMQELKGRIEFRTGEVYAYRSFFDDEIHPSMEERHPMSYLAWPKPRLLDVTKKYLALPTKEEKLVGSSVRILVPLS